MRPAVAWIPGQASRASSRPRTDKIEFVPVTPEEFARHSVEHGTPPEMAGAVQNLNELFRASRAGVLADDITNLTGIAPRSFRQWAEHHAGAFK